MYTKEAHACEMSTQKSGASSCRAILPHVHNCGVLSTGMWQLGARPRCSTSARSSSGLLRLWRLWWIRYLWWPLIGCLCWLFQFCTIHLIWGRCRGGCCSFKLLNSRSFYVSATNSGQRLKVLNLSVVSRYLKKFNKQLDEPASVVQLRERSRTAFVHTGQNNAPSPEWFSARRYCSVHSHSERVFRLIKHRNTL